MTINKLEEASTACDKCEMLEQCVTERSVINITQPGDKQEHYVLPMGAWCQKDSMGKAEVAYKKYKKAFGEHLRALLEGRENVNLYAQESARRHAEMLNELDKLFYGE